MITPELIMEVLEAGEDAVILPEEFSGILFTITSIFTGVMIITFISILIKGLTKGTNIKTEKIAGIPVPISF